jgi:hypothetical protein
VARVVGAPARAGLVEEDRAGEHLEGADPAEEVLARVVAAVAVGGPAAEVAVLAVVAVGVLVAVALADRVAPVVDRQAEAGVQVAGQAARVVAREAGAGVRVAAKAVRAVEEQFPAAYLAQVLAVELGFRLLKAAVPLATRETLPLL